MKLVAAFRAMGVALGLVLLGSLAHAVLNPPAVNGPYLGDSQTNLSSIVAAITNDNQMSFTGVISVSQTVGQANCTNLTTALNNVTTSASTGYVCLPTAIGGRELFINNATTSTIDIYSNATSFTIGTADTINGTAGTTAYTGLTNGKNAQCFSPANGVWACASGS